MCKEKGFIFYTFSLVELCLLDYPYGMDSYYILRLGKDLRTKVMKMRTQLFEKSGQSSFCCLEPCIILGPCDPTSEIPYVPCPRLPISVDGRLKYEHGQLFLPIEAEILKPLRLALATDYPISGIYLGTQQVSVPEENFVIKSVSLAILSVERKQDLTLWNVFSERHLDSDRES